MFLHWEKSTASKARTAASSLVSFDISLSKTENVVLSFPSSTASSTRNLRLSNESISKHPSELFKSLLKCRETYLTTPVTSEVIHLVQFKEFPCLSNFFVAISAWHKWPPIFLIHTNNPGLVEEISLLGLPQRTILVTGNNGSWRWRSWDPLSRQVPFSWFLRECQHMYEPQWPRHCV